MNPGHLEPVTSYENSRRGLAWKLGDAHYNRAKTHCSNGHEFTVENTRYERGGKKRVCVACAIEAKRRFRAKGKAEHG